MGLIKCLKELSANGAVRSPLSIADIVNVEDSENVKRREKITKVAVILGDPRMNDTVKKNGVYNEEDVQTVNNMKEALEMLNTQSKDEKYEFTFLDNHITLLDDLKALAPSTLVLNFCDEGYLNEALLEAHVPAFLDMMHITYSGAGLTCLGMCYDKALVRAIAVSINVPVPEEKEVNPILNDKVPTNFNYPRFLKPALGDNSVGITTGSIVHRQDELENYVKYLNDLFPDRAVLIQEYLTGTEYSVGLIGNPKTGFFALPVLEVDFSALNPNLPPILGYESKHDPESPYWTQIKYKRANSLSTEQIQLLVKQSELLFEKCKCRDYARFDFRSDANGIIKLLEVNPNPGWCWDGKFNIMAGLNGWSYPKLIGAILNETKKRMVPPNVSHA